MQFLLLSFLVMKIFSWEAFRLIWDFLYFNLRRNAANIGTSLTTYKTSEHHLHSLFKLGYVRQTDYTKQSCFQSTSLSWSRQFSHTPEILLNRKVSWETVQQDTGANEKCRRQHRNLRYWQPDLFKWKINSKDLKLSLQRPNLISITTEQVNDFNLTGEHYFTATGAVG